MEIDIFPPVISNMNAQAPVAGLRLHIHSPGLLQLGRSLLYPFFQRDIFLKAFVFQQRRLPTPTMQLNIRMITFG